MTARPLDVFLVVGEPSGDELGAGLVRALMAMADGPPRLRGVAGPAMIEAGMVSLFPLDEVAVMGIADVVASLPRLYRRAWDVIRAVLADPPDVLVIIDSPDFTHAIARRVRRRLPGLPIIDYVCPSVWAWRPGRARRMRAYVDHVLALLSFEPEALRRLHGPACTYVGHPLVERLAELRPGAAEAGSRDATPARLLVLPGSRTGEIERLTDVFGAAVTRIAERHPIEVTIPTLTRHVEHLRARTMGWAVRPTIVAGETARHAAFRGARAALAASGTVTLELALAGIPTVGAYRMPGFEYRLARRLVTASHVLLPNLILARRAMPELLQDEAEPGRLTEAVLPLLRDGPERQAQLEACREVEARMALPPGETPSRRAARVVLDMARSHHAADTARPAA